MKFFMKNKKKDCKYLFLGPKCDSVIDHVNPWRVLVFDRTLQSIAYKLVPHLYKGEKKS